ncbi:MAG: TonB-dependent receptor [bacterium]|nr:TonB-dependent receptor [bacterium]
MRRPDRIAIALLALLWTATPAALAAERAIGPEKDPVEEMIVVGEQRPAPDVLAGATTSVLSADAGLLEGARIDELLADVPGVQIRNFGGAGEPVEISIRGSRPQQVPVFLDGVRVESTLTSRTDLSALCLDVLDEIQVTRGAGAARAGSGAIGGVVNLVSRPAQKEPETKLRFSGGHFETYEGSLRHARRIGDWGLSLAYCGFGTEGDFEYQRASTSTGGGSNPVERRVNNDAERHTGLVRAERQFGRFELGLTQLTTHLERGTPGQELNQRLEARDEILTLLSIARLETSLEGMPEGQAELLVAHQHQRDDFEDPVPQFGFDGLDVETTSDSLTPRLTVSGAFDALGADLDASVLFEGRFDTRASNEANRRSRAGGAVRVEATAHWFADRLRVSPSVRVERFEDLDTEWIPGLFVEAEATDWLLLKGSASRSYRAPSFGELFLPDKGFERGNENLDAESAWNFEIGGVLTSPFASPLLDFEIEGTYFAGEIDDSIVFTRISPFTSSFVNTGRAETRGHELSVRWRPHEWIRVTAARTVTDSKDKGSGTQLPGIARSQIDARLELGPRDRFKLLGELQYTGDINTSPGGLAKLDSRVLYDASASVDLARIEAIPLPERLRSLWLVVRGRNLGNVATRDAAFFPRPGRNVTISIEGVLR